MKILITNEIENYDTITSSAPSINYPVENILDPFLEVRHQSSGTSTVITITWAADISASCFFYGYTNATSISAVYKNSSGVTIGTVSISSPVTDGGIDSEYFTKLETVRSLEITITGPSGVYIGSIGAGVCSEYKKILNNFGLGYIDNSSVSSSASGQKLQGKIRAFRVRSWRLEEQSRDEKNSIRNDYLLIGKGKAIYIDFFPGSNDIEDDDRPMYGIYTDPPEIQKNGRKFIITLNFEEAR